MRTKLFQMLVFFILFLLLSALPYRVFANDSSLLLYPGGDSSDGLASNQNTNVIFYDMTFNFSYSGGAVCLSSQNNTCTPWAIDDAVRIFVNGNQTYYQESYTHDIEPIDFSGKLRTGSNQIRVQLIDLMGPNQGGSALWLVPTSTGNNNDQATGANSETANWNTLNHTTCGFSLKYPDPLIAYGDPGMMGDLDETTSEEVFISREPWDGANSTVPSINIHCVEKSITVYSDWSLAEISAADYEANQSNPNSPATIIEPLREITFAGENAYVFKMRMNGFSGEWRGYIGYEGEKNVIEIDHNGIHFTIVYAADPMLESVISTFSFPDISESQPAMPSSEQDIQPVTPEATEVPLPPDGFSGDQGFWCFIPGFCVEAATNVGCYPQCVVTARSYRKDLTLWSGGGTSDKILAAASSQPSFMFEGKMQQVRVRSQSEAPQVGDLVIWPSDCDKAWSGGGHIGYVTSGDPFKISDSNWGKPISESECAIRTNITIPIKDCMEFITAPFSTAANQPEPEKPVDKCSQYGWFKNWLCKRGWIK